MAKETIKKVSKKVAKKKTEKPKKNTETITKVEEVIKCDNIDNKLLHIKVGNDAKPATDQDIETVQAQIEELLFENNIKCLVYVSHHCIDIQVVK